MMRREWRCRRAGYIVALLSTVTGIGEITQQERRIHYIIDACWSKTVEVRNIYARPAVWRKLAKKS